MCIRFSFLKQAGFLRGKIELSKRDTENFFFFGCICHIKRGTHQETHTAPAHTDRLETVLVTFVLLGQL